MWLFSTTAIACLALRPIYGTVRIFFEAWQLITLLLLVVLQYTTKQENCKYAPNITADETSHLCLERVLTITFRRSEFHAMFRRNSLANNSSRVVEFEQLAYEQKFWVWTVCVCLFMYMHVYSTVFQHRASDKHITSALSLRSCCANYAMRQYSVGKVAPVEAAQIGI